jgi:hypothetical protein
VKQFVEKNKSGKIIQEKTADPQEADESLWRQNIGNF